MAIGPQAQPETKAASLNHYSCRIPSTAANFQPIIAACWQRCLCRVPGGKLLVERYAVGCVQAGLRCVVGRQRCRERLASSRPKQITGADCAGNRFAIATSSCGVAVGAGVAVDSTCTAWAGSVGVATGSPLPPGKNTLNVTITPTIMITSPIVAFMDQKTPDHY